MIHRTKIKYPILFAYSVNSCNNYIYVYKFNFLSRTIVTFFNY